ncbi:uncharacterized protein METZ01_LOCUS380622, partial [marine metagenome]
MGDSLDHIRHENRQFWGFSRNFNGFRK